MNHKLMFLEELMASPFGQSLFESYTLGTYIRGTNLSEVVLLESLTGDDPLVLKVMSTQFGCTVNLKTLSELHHDNISSVLMYGGSANYVYVVKPYYSGHTLEEFVNQYDPLSPRAVIDILVAIADGVNYLHQQKPMIILRDLKPDNVIMHHNHTPVIVDLESSRAYSLKSQDTVILGTPGYASPEHFGVKETDARSDVYLLGMLLHYMITTEVWYQRKITHPRLMQESFNSLRNVIERAIAFDPDQRYQDVGAFKEALTAAKPNTPSTSTPSQPNQPKPQKPQKPQNAHWLFMPKYKILSLTIATILLLGTGAMGMQLVNTYKDTIRKSQQIQIQSNSDVLAQQGESTSQTVPGTEDRAEPLGPETPSSQDITDITEAAEITEPSEKDPSETPVETTSKAPVETTTKTPVETTTKIPVETTTTATVAQPTTAQPTTTSQTVPGTQAEVPATTSVQKTVSGEVVIYRKGDRQEISSEVNSSSLPRELPLGLKQSPYFNSTFVTYLDLSKLPQSLSDVDSMGVGSGPSSFSSLYDHIMMRYNGGEPYVRHFAPPGSNVIQFNSVGSYYYGNYIALYGNNKIRALVMVGIDESVAYKIYE